MSSVPAVFRPARLDGNFQNLHERVRQQVDLKRSQRIETLKERKLKQSEGRATRQAERLGQHSNGLQRGDAEQRRQLQQERRQQAEQKRQENRQRYEHSRQRAEDHRPGEAQRQFKRHENGQLQTQRPTRQEHGGRDGNDHNARQGGGGAASWWRKSGGWSGH